MSVGLLITVRFHDGRYHGSTVHFAARAWPPSPARMFQALVAGSARGASIPDNAKAALAWLEALSPPVITAPPAREGTAVTNYVPNNDLDARGGDLDRIGDIRAAKIIRPRFFDARSPILYAWTFDNEETSRRHAEHICDVAKDLYQLGRGVDMAWAVGEVMTSEAIAERLAAHTGPIYRPMATRGGETLACPQLGSLRSLMERHAQTRARFERHYVPSPTRTDPDRQKASGQLFLQPSKGLFANVPYNASSDRILFHIRKADASGTFAPQSLTRIVALVEGLRDRAAERLKASTWRSNDGSRETLVDRIFIGRDSRQADKAQRLRITPLPSIGHPHAEQSVRRVVVEVPPDCPIRADSVGWAFSGLPVQIVEETGEILAELVVDSGDDLMPGHYGFDDVVDFRVWRTVTPAVLPENAARRRIDPARVGEEAKRGSERADEEVRATAAVRDALRHAGIGAPVERIRVQREPFEAKGARAEAFAPDTRFSKHRLWHVEIAFSTPRTGPVVIGDGRYLGLGIMAPVKDAWRDVLVFPLASDTVVPIGDAGVLVDAARRALMALSRDDGEQVSRLFSGHDVDDGPARSGRHEHVFLVADDADGDGRVDRLVIAAPWACDHSLRPRASQRAEFERVASSLRSLRAGRLGVFDFGLPRVLEDWDPLIGPARDWSSRTDYRPTRHASRRQDLTAAVEQDIINECGRRGFPRPRVEVNKLISGPKGGEIRVQAEIHFATAIRGPVFLGRDAHRGGGAFVAKR